MAIVFRDVRARVEKIDQKEKYAELRLSTSDKQVDGTYKYSNWSFVRFVGKANQFVLEEVEEKDTITITFGKITQESWEDKDGKRQFPKTPRFVVFTAEMYKKAGKGKNEADTKASTPATEKEDEFPF